MRKNVFGRQFKRDANERKALFKGLMSSLVLDERIQTTEEKAKAIKSKVEKLVTKARVGDRHAESLLQPYLNAEAVKKMMTQVAPRFTNRQGGYTRIIKVGNRFSDNASMVLMEWVEKGVQATAGSGKKEASKKPTTKKEKLNADAKVAKPKKAPVKKTAKKEDK
jgi:large subunit ribosomal protein L17